LEGGTRVSEEKTFLLDYSFRNFIRFFLNWSSFGAFDSRLTYGKGESEYDLAYKLADRIASVGEDIKSGKSLIFDSKLVRSFKVATGWLTRKELIANADFFLSNLKYRYFESMMLPIQIASGKIGEIQDGNNLYAQKFEYQYLIEDHAYTEGDGEDVGFSLPGFATGNVGFVPGVNTGIETDPTVGTWIKAITPADIARWNATIGSGGNTLGDWFDVLSLAPEVNTQDLRFQYKTDSPNDLNKVITYIAAQLTLDASFIGTSLLIGKLPDGSRPYHQLKEWFSVGTIEIYLIVATNGDITLESKDPGFNLPTGLTDEVKYFINLNYKPKPGLVVITGKWIVDPTGTTCEAGNTGYQMNAQLMRVSDDAYLLPLDINDNYCMSSGLAQALMATPTIDPLYRTYNSINCAIVGGKWIIDTSFWSCEPGNTGYRVFPRSLRVSNDAFELPFDTNDDYCAATGLPQAVSPTATSNAGYRELNLLACPIGGGGGGSDVNFSLEQVGRRLKFSGSVSIACTIVLTVIYDNVKRDVDGLELSRTGPHTDTLNLYGGQYSVTSPSSITQGPYDTIEISSFSFTPDICGSNNLFVNGQAGTAGGTII
jgi:hypothetical protein